MIRVLSCIACFLMFLTSRPAHAEYLLGPDDNVTVKVYEWPDLSGDFKVGADGTISFPVIGAVAASGLSTEQLESAIEDMLKRQARAKDAPSVAIQVKEYRSFFIVGDVQRPGAYAFRPGLTALQAVSVAGGFFRFSDPGLLRLERDAILQRGELRVLKDKLLALTARNARLNAERSGATEIVFPDGETFNRRDPKIAELVQRETLVFQSRRSELNTQLAGFVDLQKLYQGEIEALTSQIESEKKQAGLVQRELDELRGLAARGLAANPRLFLVERTIAEIEGSQRNLEALIARSRQSIAQAGQQADELKSKFRERVDAEIDAVTSEMRDTRARMDTASRLVAEAEDTAPTAIARRLRNTPNRPQYLVSRRNSDGTARETVVSSFDQIEPGDVLQVDASPAGVTESEAEAAHASRGEATRLGAR